MGMRDTSGMSPVAAQAIKNINEGHAPYQERRAFRRKVGMAVAQAALTGIQGGLKSKESYDGGLAREAAQKDAAVKAALKNAARPPTTPPDPNATDEYGLPRSPTDYGAAMDRSVQAGHPYTPESLAKDIQSQIAANASAENAPIAGRWTEQGFKNGDMSAAVNGSDINKARDAMQFGGLMNSHISDGVADPPPMPDMTLTQPQMGRRY